MCNNLQDREDKCRNQKSAAATLSNTSKEEQRPLCASLDCKKTATSQSETVKQFSNLRLKQKLKPEKDTALVQ